MNRNLRGNFYQINGRFALMVVLLFCVLGAKGLRFRSSLCSLKLVALLGLILMAGNAWGQDDNMPLNHVPYYIEGPANGDGYSAGNLTTHYYLCPTENWKYYDATNNAVTNNNTGMPFLTTYQCLNPSSNYTTPNKAIWVFEKQSGTDYRIKNVGENKYMTSHTAVLSNKGRMRIHLQATESEGALFTLTYNSSYYRIKAKGNVSDGYCYVNVNKGNKPYLTGYGENIDNIATGGILGTYNTNPSDANFNFYIRIHPDYVAPTITAVDDNHYTITPAITLPEGFSIRYTTDGSLVPSPTNGTEYTLNTQIEITSTCTLRAWMVGTLESTPVMSLVASQYVDLGVPVPTFAVLCENELEISCPGMVIDSIYYSINDLDPTGDAGTLYTEPFTTGLTDGCNVSAVAYLDGTTSDVVQFTYHPNTKRPVISFSDDVVTITNDPDALSATIYYTLDGSDPDPDNAGSGAPTSVYDDDDPFNISSYESQDLEIRAVAKLSDRGASCPVTVLKRPEKPAIIDEHICIGSESRHYFTITTRPGRYYYYALTNGATNNPPALGDFKPYTGQVDIDTVAEYNPSSTAVRVYAYSTYPEEVDVTIVPSAITSKLHDMNYTAVPTITHTSTNEGATVTITGSGTIKYRINGGTEQTYSSPFSLSIGQNYIITATAQASGQGESCTATHWVYLPNEICDLDDIDELDGFYKLTCDIEDASGFSTSIGTTSTPFTGYFDGGGHTITGLEVPLFGVTSGDAIVHDIKLKDVDISGEGNVGAIVCEAKGNTRIYNCGILDGSVSGGTNVGGMVGLIQSGSQVRVVNCYSYADVSGSEYAAGIVGLNEGTVSEDGTVGDVRIALCMMYGNVSDASNISPVYGGNHVDNKKKFTEYNYYLYGNERDANGVRIKKIPYTAYNDQIAIDNEEFLTRFPFYCHILNTHRELAAFFLFGEASCNHLGYIADDYIAEIGHWTLKKDVAPYPIIEAWPTNTRKVLDAPTPTNILTEMGGTEHSGYLYITVKIGNNTYENDAFGQHYKLPITDMDEDNYDFTWGKVVLPFANEFEVNTDYSKICTGWKIIGITGGTEGTFANYNVSDRNCTIKDFYNTTGFIFAQGGNYIVPYGVTAITIEANFANAYYLCDESYEIAYEKDKPGTAGNVSGYVTRTQLAGATPSTYHGQRVYHTVMEALSAMSNSGTTHAQAVVLVGNYHRDDESLSNYTSKGYTIMSIDADNNQEPDYAVYSNNTQNRPAIPPTRFDFVAFIPLGMSSHVTGSKFYPNTPIWKPRGWFEITETGLMYANQFELESNNFNTSSNDKRNYRCIINGGYFTQMVRGFAAACTQVSYYQIGGKAYVKEFYPGNHSTRSHANKLVPINVTGGEIEQCFMTGYGKGTAYGANIYFWCAGGKIHKFLGAYMEKPKQTTSNEGNVNMTAEIDHAIIGRFFGGGTTQNARITGNIEVTINNSRVDFYCGGPEFGDMSSGKTVTTNATNTTFGEYYGAGFGGTATTYRNDEDGNIPLQNTLPYPEEYFPDYYGVDSDTGRLYYKPGYGLGNCYKFEYIMHSRGHIGVARFYTGFAIFSLAKTGSVSNTLINCTVEESFYGGGCQGTVDGTVNSTLTDCNIIHSAFGGGFKAESNKVMVYTTEPPSLSEFTAETGIFSDFGEFPTPEEYTWEQGDEQHSNEADETNHKLYTGIDVTMSELGNVMGAITLTLDGNTVVGENVFGGGNESKSLNDATVILKDNAQVNGDVFGGGNKAFVKGKSSVIIGINIPIPPGSEEEQQQGGD